ncbi:MAG: M20/M25/M40 family metallo-hydrolase [Gammaproteobacteria bacterium]|nr:M20/M25/M40 family metallo-hydrolase [Gammaproteobacteria bacterium]
MWDDVIVPALTRYIEIPNKSPAFDNDWESHGYMDDAAQQLLDAIPQITVKNAAARIVKLPGRTPLILIDIPATNECRGNVLCYGHYDKQPEFEGWEDGLGPWTPVRRGDRLFGRGGADDGYAIFATLAAISVLDAHDIGHPRCCVIIEGCEESGSFDLPFYLAELRTVIGEPDLLICLDAECGNYDQLWLTTSLRGMISGTLNVNVLTEGIHSGGAGGIVPSSFRVLRAQIERIENARTGQLLPELHGTIPEHVVEESALAAQTLGEIVIDRYPWHGSTQPSSQDLAKLLIRNTWEPSLATVGLGGAPAPENAGNTLRPSTAAKLVFRLPPSVHAQDAAQAVKKAIEADPPCQATVNYDIEAAETGWFAKPTHPNLKESLNRASQAFFGNPLRQLGCGGTIPFLGMLEASYPRCQFVATGVLGPHSNAHGPNEFLDIPTGKNVTACMAAVLGDASEFIEATD